MKENKKKNKTLLILVPVIIILVAVIGVLAWMVINQKPEDKIVERETSGGRGTVVTPENVDQVLEEMNSPVEDGYFETEMNTEWTFPTSRTASPNAYVGNSTGNTRTIYFDVVLTDTKQLVYSSPYIPVGSSIKEFALDANLEKGTYPAQCQYHLVDDDNKEITDVSIDITLQILN